MHTAFAHSDKVGVFGVSHGHDCVNLFDQLLLLVIFEVHVPLRQSRLPGAILDKNEPNLLTNGTNANKPAR